MSKMMTLNELRTEGRSCRCGNENNDQHTLRLACSQCGNNKYIVVYFTHMDALQLECTNCGLATHIDFEQPDAQGVAFMKAQEAKSS